MKRTFVIDFCLIQKDPKESSVISFPTLFKAIFCIIKKATFPSSFILVWSIFLTGSCFQNDTVTVRRVRMENRKKTMEENTSIRNVQAFRKFRPGASQPTHCVSLCPHYGASALFVFPLIDWTVIAAEHLWTFAYSPR